MVTVADNKDSPAKPIVAVELKKRQRFGNVECPPGVYTKDHKLWDAVEAGVGRHPELVVSGDVVQHTSVPSSEPTASVPPVPAAEKGPGK